MHRIKVIDHQSRKRKVVTLFDGQWTQKLVAYLATKDTQLCRFVSYLCCYCPKSMNSYFMQTGILK